MHRALKLILIFSLSTFMASAYSAADTPSKSTSGYTNSAPVYGKKTNTITVIETYYNNGKATKNFTTYIYNLKTGNLISTQHNKNKTTFSDLNIANNTVTATTSTGNTFKMTPLPNFKASQKVPKNNTTVSITTSEKSTQQLSEITTSKSSKETPVKQPKPFMTSEEQ